MKQRWKDLPEFKDYAVSDGGEIANLKSGLHRATSINQQGIVKMSMYIGKELHTRSVAVLVAEAFVDGKDELYDTPIHLDGDRLNCAADNLMWKPRWFAVQYHRQFKTPEFHTMDVPLVEIGSGREFDSVKEVCMEYGLYYQNVYRSYVHEERVPLTNLSFRLRETTT